MFKDERAGGVEISYFPGREQRRMCRKPVENMSLREGKVEVVNLHENLKRSMLSQLPRTSGVRIHNLRSTSPDILPPYQSMHARASGERRVKCHQIAGAI